jgi:RNA polymerase sigma-70 factor (ECF subfamily)
MNDPDRDRACVERLCAGDTRALEELYDRYSDLLYSLVMRILRRTAEAEDVVQETWLQAWRNAAAYDPARGTVGAWLVMAARSRALDRVRSEGSRLRAETAAAAEPPPSPEDPSVAAASRQLSSRVIAALEQLVPQHRQVLELAYFAGLSQSEVANRLSAPLGTVKSWTRQALMRLSELVPQEEWL